MVQFQCCLQYKVREQTFVSVTLLTHTLQRHMETKSNPCQLHADAYK